MSCAATWDLRNGRMRPRRRCDRDGSLACFGSTNVRGEADIVIGQRASLYSDGSEFNMIEDGREPQTIT